MGPWDAGEVQREEARVREEFLAQGHHDLKTPLAILQGWLETFERSWDRISEDERDEALRAMSRTLRSLGDRIDALLGEIRAEILARAPLPTPVDLSELARTFAARVGGEVGVPEGTVVEADREALLLLLLHLAECQRLEGGAPTSAALTTRTDGRGLVVEVRVAGGGVPSETGALTPGAVRLRAARWLAAAVGAELSVAATDDGSVATLTFPDR